MSYGGLNKQMGAAGMGRNPVSKHQISLSLEMSRLTRDGTAGGNPSRETKFSGANADRETIISRARLATLPG